MESDEESGALFVALNRAIDRIVSDTLGANGCLPLAHLAIVELVGPDGTNSYAVAFPEEQTVTRSVGLANVLRLHVEKTLEESLMQSWYVYEDEEDDE